MLIRTNEGTEGTFSHASEATMKLLRENASVLLTILSAVVSDPLYKWSVSPVKARLRQRSDIEEEEVTKKIGVHGNDTSLQNVMINEDKNDAASRAIAKIEEKLQGYENGTTGECQTVEGQVQLLINAARDPDNLCTLYFGWAPWV
jgi:ataxia telangiectasia mutated family protein